jgi:hypothetical protein
MDLDLISKLCGFDPLELLETVEFPNDRYERLLRLSKDARMVRRDFLNIFHNVTNDHFKDGNTKDGHSIRTSHK